MFSGALWPATADPFSVRSTSGPIVDRWVSDASRRGAGSICVRATDVDREKARIEIVVIW
ncbi:hypothetical protein C1703_31125 [Streptomyces sp. Go-475]|nr:hypothetical protein C1703_31125 [Streptomyces sp. Go-475]